MGKRSTFKRMKNDFYPTPYSCVLPLLPHLADKTKYIEPCVGDGRLCDHLSIHGHECVGRYDLPDDFATKKYDTSNAEFFITNPPWTRELLHPAIHNLRQQLPTWLLFDASWAYTRQAKDYLPYCLKIVTIGRVKWIENSKHTGKDDSAWYLFMPEKVETRFYGKI